MKEYLSVLAACPLFRSIHPDDLLRMLNCLDGQIVVYAKGQIILHQGDPASTFGVVLKGTAQVIRGNTHGSHVILSSLEPGSLFAESFACAALEALPVQVVAVTDVVVLLLKHTRVTHACRKGCLSHSRLVTSLLEVVARKNLSLNQKLDIVMQRTTRDKLIAYLHCLEREAGSPRFTIPFARQELADYLGVDRSAMSTELSKLKADGLIAFHKNTFELLHPDETVAFRF